LTATALFGAAHIKRKEVFIMLMPMLWRNDYDDVLDPFFGWDQMTDRFWGNDLMEYSGMKTDVIENDHDYMLQADLPGFKKEDIGIDLKNGVLTISASHNDNNDTKDKDGKYVRRERRMMSYQRSFTVGDEISPEDINAKYENGVLSVSIPKKEIEAKNGDVKRIEVK
jgi:HSP20 family molecular chaperone IbpA